MVRLTKNDTKIIGTMYSSIRRCDKVANHYHILYRERWSETNNNIFDFRDNIKLAAFFKLCQY